MKGLFGKLNTLTEKRGKAFAVATVCCILIVLAAAGTTLALLISEAGGISNLFSKGTVSVELHESFSSNVKDDVKVENTGSAPAFIRVKLVTYWADENGSPVGETAPVIPASAIDTANWIAGSSGIYYYKKTLNSGEMTTDLFASASLTLASDDEKGYVQVVEVLAEGIQATAEAASDAWGATVSGGRITNVR